MGVADHFLTPPIIAEALDEFGGVAVDPCSNPCSLIKARRAVWYAPHWKEAWGADPLPSGVEWGDGLTVRRVDGLWFNNPPYSDPNEWVRIGTSIVAESAPREAEAIMLLQADTSTKIWQKVIFPQWTRVLFWDGRLSYHVPGPALIAPTKEERKAGVVAWKRAMVKTSTFDSAPVVMKPAPITTEPAAGPARFASALIYNGRRPELFEEVFTGCGFVTG